MKVIMILLSYFVYNINNILKIIKHNLWLNLCLYFSRVMSSIPQDMHNPYWRIHVSKLPQQWGVYSDLSIIKALKDLKNL